MPRLLFSIESRHLPSGVFGADVDDIMRDPLAAKLGLVSSNGKTRRKRKKRRAKSGGSGLRQVGRVPRYKWMDDNGGFKREWFKC